MAGYESPPQSLAIGDSAWPATFAIRLVPAYDDSSDNARNAACHEVRASAYLFLLVCKARLCDAGGLPSDGDDLIKAATDVGTISLTFCVIS